jgi:putative SOS response-associated peptidase YedK
VSTLFDDLELGPIEFQPRYNIAPTQDVLAVRAAPSGAYQTARLRWGLVPAWAKDLSIGSRMINARAETVAEKPAFRSAFTKRRCLVVADGFFEWKADHAAKRKQPYYVTAADRGPFCFAGIWEAWKDKTTGQSVESCSIITTAANSRIRPLHDRMPCVVPREDFGIWLDPEFKVSAELDRILAGDGIDWSFRPVSTVVNNARHDQPDCIEEIPA